MRYTFKPLPELYFGVLVAAGTVLLLELASLNPEGVTDWRTWGVALGAAAIRAAAGAAIDYLRRSMTSEPDPAPEPAVAPELVTALADELERRREERVQARLRAVQGGPS